ncbi:hypothetical protein N0V91_006453 [Didymella pomorum]|uniref:Uncharacterized protein n=1 Tax=Didymella pomorum TaxID=749634 RepID=A0A9W8ZCG1_9PLEO|nr:hypothetical protein N0V91_006453 [Didymella pomorum]
MVLTLPLCYTTLSWRWSSASLREASSPGIEKQLWVKGQKKVSVPEEIQQGRIPPCWATSELLELRRVGEKALLPLLGSSAVGDARVVVVGGDDTTEQQDVDGGTEGPEEGVH